MPSALADWAKSTSYSTSTDVVFLDLAKASDIVPHERLLLKLNSHGIEGDLLVWFRTFLTQSPKQRVVRGTCCS